MSRDVEQRLQRAGEGFPGVGDGAGGLAGVVARGRRARTMGRALRVSMAGVLVAGTAVAAPGVLDRIADEPPPVVTGVDESVDRDEVVDEAPEIEVTSPRDGSIVDDEAVEFAGTVSVGAEVTVGPFPVEVAPDGRWRITLELDEGENRLTFWATDRAGNRSFDTITVVRATPTAVGELDEEADEGADEVVEEAEPAEPEPVVVPVRQEEPKAEPAPAPKEEPKAEPKPAPKEEPKQESATYAFTSNQKYGSCNEAVPYDEFWGKAKPGTQVWVYSEYGEKKVTANGNGEWFARVEFPTAPQGKPFQVKTKSMHTGEKVFFEFVNTGEGGGHAEPVSWSAWQHESHVEWDPPYNYYEGTAPAGTVVEVASPYGDARTEADANGHWKTKVWFESAPYGTKTWTVVVESSNGDRATFEFTGTRPEPEPEPKPEPEPEAEEVAFTSDQIHDVTDDDPPHSLYAGTATPGHKIIVFNEWGEGVAHADDNGNWSLWVEFPGAPRGQDIPVHVKHWETGEKHTYELQVI